MSENMDIQVDKQENSDKKSGKDDPLSTFLWSKEVRDGTNMKNATISTETRLNPMLQIGHTQRRLLRLISPFPDIKFRKKKKKINKYEDTGTTISEEDVQYTIENFDRSDYLDEDKTTILTEDVLNNIDEYRFVIVADKETDEKFLCRVDHIVRLSFEDTLYESKSVTKRFKDTDDAEQFAEEIRNDKSNFKLFYDDDVKLRQEYQNILDMVSESYLESTLSKYMTYLIGFSIGMYLNYPTFSLNLLSVVVGVQSMILMVNTKAKFGTYINEYDVDKKAQGIKIDNQYNTEEEVDIIVDAEMTDNEIVVKPENLDTKWIFDVDNGILSDEGFRFFNQEGRNILIDDSTHMKARRFVDDKSLPLSEDGKWYLCSSLPRSN